jgi:hypothetical protein
MLDIRKSPGALGLFRAFSLLMESKAGTLVLF